ncbi:MAG: hypothetical protein LAT54_04770 [Cryomorphaceae bacterium]|nr:hypothetical protein [Cryomorphaceae bacterium]
MRHLIILSLAVALFGCSTSEEVKWSTSTLTVTATGPLFEGSNTGTYEWDIDLTKAIDGIEDLSQLSEARLIEIKVSAEEPDMVEDVTIQLAGEKSGMQKVAFMDGSGKIQVAEKQENLASFFQDKYPTVVADFNLLDDWFDDFIFDVELTFTFKIKSP